MKALNRPLANRGNRAEAQFRVRPRHGSDAGLSEERSYVRRTLPLGFLSGLGAVVRGDFDGPRRAGAIVFGLFATTAGYLGAGREARRISRHRAEEPGDGEGGSPRILMVTPRSPLAQGGVERHVMEVSRRMAASGAHVEVLCTEPGGPAVSEQIRDGVKIRTVRAWPAERDWCFAPRLWREMARQRWDVIHVQSYHTLVAPLAMLRALTLGTPYVVTFHGGGHSAEFRNRARRLQRRLLRPLLARARRLVAVARFEIDEEHGAELDLPAGAVRPDPQRDRSRLLPAIGLERGAGRLREDRVDRPAGALQGPPQGACCLPLRARGKAGVAALHRRHRAIRAAAARAGGRARCR